MAPKGSRTPLWLPLLISVVAALGLLLVVFHSGLLAAVQNVVSIGPPVLSSHRSQSGPASNRLPSKTVTFGAHPLLETFSPSADEDWEQMLLPRKGGFLWVAYNETSDEAWGIGMFHALHCLKMLRKAIRSEPMKNSRGVSDSAGSEYRSERRAKPTLGHPDLSPNHLGHCIGYIAQVRFCRCTQCEPFADQISICCARLTVRLSPHG